MASTRATCSSTARTSPWTCGRRSTASAEGGWSEAELDLGALSLRLEREATFLAPVGQLRSLGYGFYSRVFSTSSGWIVRLARTPDAAERHDRECRVLPALAGQLSVAIPQPVRALPPCEEAAFGAIAYRELPGRLMNERDIREPGWEVLARDVGRELARLHAASLLGEPGRGVPPFRPSDFEELRAIVSPGLRERLSAPEWEAIDAWWAAFLADTSLLDWVPVLTHGDVWWGNIMVDRSRLSGILDWEFLSLGDAAWDLATTVQFGAAFHRQLVAEYLRHRTLDSYWQHRADQWWPLRAFFGVQFAVDRLDEDEWRESLEKLRRGPILTPSHP